MKKYMHFLRCALFPKQEKQIHDNTCFKQHAFWVDPLGVSDDFCIFKLSCFPPPEHGTNREKKGSCWGPFFELDPKKSQRAHSDRKSGQKGAHSEFWRRPKGPELAGHPATVSHSGFSSVADDSESKCELLHEQASKSFFPVDVDSCMFLSQKLVVSKTWPLQSVTSLWHPNANSG